MRRLLAYLKPYWPALLISSALLGVNSLLQVAGPLLVKQAIDRYLSPSGSPGIAFLNGLLSSDRWRGLAEISLLFFAVHFLMLLVDYAQNYVTQWAGQHAMFDLRCELVTRLQSLDIAFFDRIPMGRLLTRVTTDVEALNELFSSGVIAMLGDLLMLAVMLAAMSRLSPALTLLLVGIAPLVLLAAWLFRRVASESYRRIRVAIARVNACLAEQINGMTVVQLLNSERRSVAQFEGVNREHMEAYKASIIANGWFNPAIEFIGVIALAGVLAWGGYSTIGGGLTIGVVVAFFQYAARFFRPMQELSDRYNVLQSAVASSERIFRLLDTEPVIAGPAAPKAPPAEPAAIEFDHVWFAYTGEDWVLRDVTFTLPAAETVALVGHTGAGKTTIVSLMLRFYDPQRGAIRIGGVDIREFDPRELRRRFGVVLQEPFLFTGTILENIRLGAGHISEEEVMAPVELVNLREFLDAMPNGLHETLPERGNGLSAGQKQLISFARAVTLNPPFLILDEATSSVDTETGFRIREALALLLADRTAILIAHRLSSVASADHILVMERGVLREQGNHLELMERKGVYWRLQTTRQEASRRLAVRVAPVEMTS